MSMTLAVLVKEVPDTYGDRALDLETGLTCRADADLVIDEIGERALEVALRVQDQDPDTRIALVTMGPASAEASLRRCLAMGATSAIHVLDDELIGADLGLTAEVLAAALKRTECDVVIAGNQSTDGAGGVIPAMVAELLDVPAALNLSSVDIGPEAVSGSRVTDGGTVRVEASTPALISVTEALPTARLPNFKGIMAAKKKPLEVVSLADLGVTALPPDASRTIMLSLQEKPVREAGVKIVDAGDAGTRLADFLITNRLAEGDRHAFSS